jgi:hypothetical protein
MRYHKKFQRVKPEVLEATKKLRKGWADSTDSEKWVKMDKWIGTASSVYGMRRPLLCIDATAGSGYYLIAENEIHMSKASIITLIHEFRHAMQRQGKARGWSGRQSDLEHDARGWSLSIYFKVAPVSFRRLVQEGKIFHITPADLMPARV